MALDYSWDVSASRYVSLYERARAVAVADAE
jgi:glycogen synthase